MDSSERHVVSTTISTSPCARRSETVAPRYPGTRRSSGRTFLEKWSRYFGNCASVVRAVQRRKMVPDAATAEEVGGSLPTTTFQRRTSHFLTSPFWTYGSLRAKDSTLVLSSTWKTIKARSEGSASAPAKT